MTRGQIILTLALALIFISLINSFSSEKQIPISYDTFERHVIADEVTDFRLLDDRRTVYYSVRANSSVYKTAFPTEGHAERIIDELIKDGVILHIDPPVQPNYFFSFLFSIFPILLLIGAMVYIYRKQQSMISGGGAGGLLGQNPAKLVVPEKNTITLADVASNPGDLDDVHEIIDFLKDPQKYHDANAKLPHGLLLAGPPGVGKTLLAKAIAGEANVPFFTISGSDFVEMFVGVGASRVRSMFDALRAAQPAMLFIDEIDAVGGHRSSAGGIRHQEAEQTLNQLLTEMSGFNTSQDSVMIIADTNRPDMLDPALLRPGRFDRHIAIGLPDINAREKILQVHTKGHRLSKDVNLRVIARGTPGMSGADLENLINEAAMIVGKNRRKIIAMKDLEEARDKIFMGREKSLAMDDSEKEMTAFHEAGHAIAAYFTSKHDPVYKVSIIPRNMALGVTMFLKEEDQYSMSQVELKSKLIGLMGGRAAEEIQYGEDNISTGAANDLEKATEIARNMVTKWGFSPTGLISFKDKDYYLFSDDTKEKIDNQVRDLLQSSYDTAIETLKTNKDKLKSVAERLIEKETIGGDEFQEIMNDK